MEKPIIIINHLSKQYRLGTVGTGTLRSDLNRWWHQIRGMDDPTLKIGSVNKLDLNDGEYIWALKDINLEIKKGEVLGIIGKNGAGKSTLLKILSRVTSPTEGTIEINGKIASLLEVGTGFHPELTGKENIFLNGAILGLRKKEIKALFDEIVDFAGVQKYINTPVKRYSSGMYVRLAFAVAAHLEPDILIVDEVLAVGDAEFQKKALGKMHEISNDSGRTVIFVSHNMSSIQALCSTCVVLENGRLIYTGNTEDSVAHYMRQIKENLNQDISRRIERSGNQLVKFVNISFLHAKSKKKLDVILSGTPVLIEFEYACENPDEVKNLNIAIAFSHFLSGEKFVCANLYTGIKFGKLNHTGRIYCKITKWPLNTGNYFYRIQAEANGEITDRIENAGEINVEYGDFFGTGYIVPPHLNGALIEQEWLID